MLDRPDDSGVERDHDADVELDWSAAKQAVCSGSPTRRPLQEVPREASVERFLTKRIWDWNAIKGAVRGEPPPPVEVAPPEPPTLYRWRFTDDERKRLAKILCKDGGYDADKAATIIDDVEGWVRLWHLGVEGEAEGRAVRKMAEAYSRRVHRQLHGRQFTGLPPTINDWRDPDFAPGALRILRNHALIRTGRNTRFRWLYEFLEKLCDIAHVRHGNVGRAIEQAAKEQRAENST